ncbi:hypothetical protein SAMN03159341_101544 [Paenibacillus sp. 1_12]|uniref:GAF domain-containing protein n=1 Tax=Paenibacillus sp. 1_12 TaxID=1566278 RepID=UPI0008F39D0A|nr:GAF domain-containing protein [Paenibacillus sp. 1_12]SFK78075.1 hypothetical protein SAMN03159341_101544 [Paenibacillus sp. 1_12]
MVEYEGDPIRRLIDHLRISSSNDFAALALPREDGRTFAWYYASGNMNYRYKWMIVKRGKGLPGLAWMLGEAVAMDASSRDLAGVKLECSLMTAEGLRSAAAAPLGSSASPSGIVIMGTRQARLYTASELQYLNSCAIEMNFAIQLQKYGHQAHQTEQGMTSEPSTYSNEPI